MEEGINKAQLANAVIRGMVSIYGNLPLNYPEISICFTDDIYETILENDRKYAEETHLSEEAWLGGLLYINKENESIIYIKNSDKSDKGIANMIISLAHESTHFFDYIYYSQFTRNDNLRLLQSNRPFLFWTEFHATYISILYAIKNSILFLEKDKILTNLEQEFKTYYENNKPLQLEPTVNYSSRKFGEYLAWKSTYDELPKYPMKVIFNAKLGKIYEFFYMHRSFEVLKNDIDELNSIIYALENT